MTVKLLNELAKHHNKNHPGNSIDGKLRKQELVDELHTRGVCDDTREDADDDDDTREDADDDDDMREDADDDAFVEQIRRVDAVTLQKIKSMLRGQSQPSSRRASERVRFLPARSNATPADAVVTWSANGAFDEDTRPIRPVSLGAQPLGTPSARPLPPSPFSPPPTRVCTDRYVFMYGSWTYNDMKRQVSANLQRAAPALLKDYRQVFGGHPCAVSVQYSPGNVVVGSLYAVSQGDYAVFDRRMTSKHYDRRIVPITRCSIEDSTYNETVENVCVFVRKEKEMLTFCGPTTSQLDALQTVIDETWGKGMQTLTYNAPYF